MNKCKKLIVAFGCLWLSATNYAQTYQWATKSNGGSIAVSADQSGNSYALRSDSFIEKRNSSGVLVWNNYISGAFYINDMTTDKLGNSYVTGTYNSDRYQSDIIENGPGKSLYVGGVSVSIPYTVVPEGNNIGSKMFFAKINTSGVLVWVKTFSTTTDFSVGHSVTTDINNNVYLLAEGSNSMVFPGLSGLGNVHPLFILKVNSSGVEVFVKNVTNLYFDNNFNIRGKNEIAVNNSGEVIISKYFGGTRVFNPLGSSSSLTSAGGDDIFIAKYDAAGSFQWVKRIGGTSIDEVNTILLDNSGNSYMCGLFTGTVDFDPNATIANKSSLGGSDMFISSLTTTGAYRWASTIGGTGNESRCTMTRTDFDLEVSGGFSGTMDFDPTAGVTNLTSLGARDIFMVYLPMTGGPSSAAYATGSTGDDIVYDICVNKVASSLILFQTGNFAGTVDFNPSPTVNNLTAVGTQMCTIKTTMGITSGMVLPNDYVAIENLEGTAAGLSLQIIPTKINIFPNPCTSVFTIDLEDQIGLVKIYNSFGSLVSQSHVENRSLINLSDLESGVYVISVELKTGIEQKRIVKL
jgi:hypothetical protein